MNIDLVKVKSAFGGHLLQTQIDGINAIVAAFATNGDGNKSHLAYLLGTAKEETANTMQPISEYGHGHGHAYGVVDSTGKAPYGRGFVQLTWAANYQKADAKLNLGGKLAHDYDLALDIHIAAQIIVHGCLEGWFTGKKLSDYSNFVDMRHVVNGTDRAQLIAGYANEFLAALT